MSERILIVEDEANIASFVAAYLQKAGYQVERAATGAEGIEKAASASPALIVLDLNLPDMDGLEVCRTLRANSAPPILMLTARDDDVDKIVGLEVGADDYLTKPFNPRELVARIRSILRRATAPPPKSKGRKTHGSIVIDAGRRELTVEGRQIQLAPKEFDLFWELLDHRGMVLTREQLLERVWGYTFAGDTRTVDVHVRQLRRKIGEECPVVTVWGVGYKVADDAAAVSRTRLVLLFLVSLMLAAAIFVAVAVRQFDGYQRSDSERRRARQASHTADILATIQESKLKSGDTFTLTKDLSGVSDARIFFFSHLGLGLGVGARLERLPKGYGPVIDWTRLEAHRTQTFDMRIDGRSYVAVAAPAFFKESQTIPIGAVVLAKETGSLSASTLVLTARVLPALALAVFGALLLAVFLTRRVTRPVEELSAASEKIARGIYDIEIETSSQDELGQLARRFEDMALRLKEANEHERNFLMRISHELRTPLTAIQGHVQAISDGVIDDPAEQQASLDVVLAESERLQRLIGDLLDLAKLEARRFSLNREHVDLDEVCAQAVRSQREHARAQGIDLRLSSDGGPFVVTGDGDRLLQVVGNLLANALRWTPPGGEVVVGLSTDGRTASITVADSGPGVPPERRASIFRPFTSLDPSGTGLGLPVASELAGAMGGRIEVGDRPGGGALFTVSFPLGDGAGRSTRGGRATAARG